MTPITFIISKLAIGHNYVVYSMWLTIAFGVFYYLTRRLSP